MIGCVNAAGQTIPPLFIFPRVHYKDHMTNGGPPGCIGAANPSGWSSAKIFLQFLEHIISYTKPTQGKPILIVMDNHDTHISIDVIDKAKNSGVVLLTIHPHTSHKMQPLDPVVFGPYKTFYHKTAEDWMLSNPGKPISIYDVAGIAGKAYLQAFTPKNIVKSFEGTGLWPVNTNIFIESTLADKSTSSTAPCDQTSNCLTLIPAEHLSTPSTSVSNPVPSTSFQVDYPTSGSLAAPQSEYTSPVTDLPLNISIEYIAPFPKAPARKDLQGRGMRKKGKTRILTSTPENLAIMSELLNRKKKSTPREKEPKEKVKKKLYKLPSSSSSDSEDDDQIPFCDTSDEMDCDNMVEEHDFPEFPSEIDLDIVVGDFILVKLCSKKLVKHYVAKVLETIDNNTSYIVKFYAKTQQNFHFIEGKEEPYAVDFQDIVLKLPLPQSVEESKRFISHIKFNVTFDNYNMF
ncbi:uncharacterized protein LOC126884395 [Diabrotica virgifera virgifera]|uniref:DDE-1 domain-containing protein n=1 Tax=Diabrotica virgifera virgifera TaxID=50390 RepID=A0ABM5K7V1_DIAVI|nr:uncharacterized protein LOC126884395 [Diabrotica virgifera virgifera]